MIVFPVISGICCLVVILSFCIPFLANPALLDFPKDGPRSSRDIMKAAEPHDFSRATLYRARQRLQLTVTRTKIGTPDQRSHWGLPKATEAAARSGNELAIAELAAMG